jgi:hypothetical protein
VTKEVAFRRTFSTKTLRCSAIVFISKNMFAISYYSIQCCEFQKMPKFLPNIPLGMPGSCRADMSCAPWRHRVSPV